MKIVIDLSALNKDNLLRVVKWLYRYARCIVALHINPVKLTGRESDGKLSRNVSRMYCHNCNTTWGNTEGAWFEPERRELKQLKVRSA